MIGADASARSLDWAFARFLSQRSRLPNSQKPGFERLLQRLSEQLHQGHNCVLIDDGEGELVRQSGLAAEAGLRLSGMPLIVERNRLYLERYWQYEQRLANQVRSRAKAFHSVSDWAALSELYFGPVTDANAGQRRAAELALTRSFAMITGGPGTGKTTAVVNILAMLQSVAAEPLLVALAGPTGKAAVRLQESIAMHKADLPCADFVKASIPEQVSTLHRLLGAKPPSPYFRHDADHPLPHDLVMVDEASMIDLALMSKLLDALKPSARLILIGDKEQLASIESGAVLADLTQAMPDRTVELTYTHRFDGAIKTLAALINSQQEQAAWQWLAAGQTSVSLLTGDPIAYAAQRQHDYLALLADGAPFEVVSRARAGFQVLCANKHGRHGVADFNARVEQSLLRSRKIDAAATWYAGRPVMVTENHPALNLYNGDTGICMPDRSQAGKLLVYFQRDGGAATSYLPSRLPACETAYAMTVHKSQGSEFGEVLIALPDRMNPVLTKELLYTAVTRARAAVRLVGSETVFKAALRQKVVRVTGLIEKLTVDEGAMG